MTSISADAIRAETVMITGHGGDAIEAYRAVSLVPGSRGGIVWIHHMPGYDRETKEFVRRLAVAGYNTICPNLYWREAPGAEPDDAAASARAAGGVPDDRLLGDVDGAAAHLRVGRPGRDSRDRHVVCGDNPLQLVSARLRRLQRHLWLPGGGHRTACLDVHDLAGGVDRSRI